MTALALSQLRTTPGIVCLEPRLAATWPRERWCCLIAIPGVRLKSGWGGSAQEAEELNTMKPRTYLILALLAAVVTLLATTSRPVERAKPMDAEIRVFEDGSVEMTFKERTGR